MDHDPFDGLTPEELIMAYQAQRLTGVDLLQRAIDEFLENPPTDGDCDLLLAVADEYSVEDLTGAR
jgi:hypothetical protein